MSAGHRQAKRRLADLKAQLTRAESTIAAFDAVIDDVPGAPLKRALFDRRQFHVAKKLEVEDAIVAGVLPP